MSIQTTSSTSEIVAQVRAFLAQHIADYTFRDDEDIFGSGHVSSLFAMQIVLFVEQEFDIGITNADLDIENFRSINAISQFIERKRSL